MKPIRLDHLLVGMICLVTALSFTSAPAQASATITVINNDGAGEGFNSATPRSPVGGNPGTTLGAQRFNAFQRAANIWAAAVTSGVTIRIAAEFNPLTCDAFSAILGSCGPNSMWRDFTGAPLASTWFADALASKLKGSDMDPAADDMAAEFNSSLDNGGCGGFPMTWYYGFDGNPGGSQLDFMSTILHEIGHGLGFLSVVDPSTGAELSGFDDVFERNLEDHSSGLSWNTMSNAQRAASAIDTGDLHWKGATVVANGGYLTSGRHAASGHVRMYAPNPLQGGSSVSHWDTALSPDEMLEPSYTAPDHKILALSDELLEDIYWGRVNIIPEATDTNGDWQDEIGVFRNGMWFFSHSTDYNGTDLTRAFGSPVAGRDSPEIGEFGCSSSGYPDLKNDLVILRKAFSTWQATASPDWGSTPDLTKTFGTTNHKRISTRRMDTNGDGCSDIGVFRNGCFDILESPGYVTVAKHYCFGLGTDVPLAGDLNEDGLSDLILWRASSSHYTYRLSTAYSSDGTADLGAGDVPLVADLNGDGKADLGSYKPLYSTFRFTYSPDFVGVDLTKTHGVNGDIPMLADVNGDRIPDIGVFRNATARWWFKCSVGWGSTCLDKSFGQPGDNPIFGKPPGM